MPTVKNVDWVVCKRCEESESPSDVGIRLPDGELCWAHAFEAFTKEPDSKAAADFRAALDRLGAPEASLDARGVAVTAELLKLMIGAAWKEDYKPVLKDAQFIRANFHDPRGHKFSFEGVIFEGSTSFRKAIFKEGADFTGAEFRARVEFIEVNFEHNAWFPKAIFQDNAFFAAAIFKRLAWFERTVFMKMAAFDSRTPQDGAIMTTPGMDSATFLGEANFDDATFTEAHFDGVGFEAEVRFDKTNFELAGWNRASFNGYPVVFQHATFEKESSFDNSVFANEADFTGARFKKWAWFGGSVFKKSALFDEADFGEMANSEEMYHLHNLNISSVERTRVPETGFDHAVFQGIVGFAKAAFKNKTTFCGTSFQSEPGSTR